MIDEGNVSLDFLRRKAQMVQDAVVKHTADSLAQTAQTIAAQADQTFMADAPTREEINAKLEAVEARVDGKLAEIRSDVKSLITTVGELRADTKSTRTTVVVTGVGSVLAVLALVIGLWQAGLGAQANMLSAFQAGLTALSTAKPPDQPKP